MVLMLMSFETWPQNGIERLSTGTIGYDMFDCFHSGWMRTYEKS